MFKRFISAICSEKSEPTLRQQLQGVHATADIAMQRRARKLSADPKTVPYLRC
jgi:hypothetical protein